MLNNITHLTFDCYGTLIDWERGILMATQPILARYGIQPNPADILQNFVRHEARLEAKAWKPYREVLRAVMAQMSADFAITLSEKEQDVLADSLPEWPPFPDTIETLQKLSKRFQLAILSNIDDALFDQTRQRLKCDFAVVITAEQVKSYKPGPAHFQEALRRLGVNPSQILHVAQSLYHDHIPARWLGWHTARIDRPSLLPGTGLAPEANVQPDLILPDLASLAAILLPEK